MTTKETVERHYYNKRKIVITCDICGRDYTSRTDIKRCMVCGKDVCLGCVVNIGRNPKMWHDYDRWCCKICWAAGKDRREILGAAEEVFTKVIEEQFAIWRHDAGCDKSG